jgi:hypothetical protein
MPQQFLNDPQIRATFQEMCCKAMAQHMRMDVAEAGLYAKPSKQPANRSSSSESWTVVSVGRF